MKVLKLQKHFSLLLKNPTLRINISLFFGMIINSLYIAGNLASALLYKNIWSATLTAYHSLFLTIRFYLLSARRISGRELEAKPICFRVGIILLFLDLAATAMMVYTVRSGSLAEYSGIVLLGFLAYTVYSLTSSVLGMRRFANDNQPLHFAVKNMTLTAALMSVFNLQYSVLVSLGTELEVIGRIIALVGFCIFFVIISLAVRLIVKNAPTLR